MKIIHIASECAPFIASGGLGDVIGALPKAIKREDCNAEISVILPYYDKIREKFHQSLKKKCDIAFYLSWRESGASIYQYVKDEITYYFIENHRYFERGCLYGEYDDAERFAFFSKATIEFMLKTNEIPDIIHAHDWQAALSIIYLKTVYKERSDFLKTRTLFTIHNIEYQGKFPLEFFTDIFGISNEYLSTTEYDGCLNLMKGALTLSDYISTVSPNYKNELAHDYFAMGLAPVINSVSHKMRGIINGIDYDTFSPSKDKDIYFSYNKDNVDEGKRKNKVSLQKELGLKESENIPMLAIISRLTSSKGMDLILRIIEELLSENLQLVILGTGEEKYEEEFIKLSYKHSNMSAIIKFDRVLSKKIYAASDIFIMPSKREPCGLSQMIACAYGSVPIVRSVGGLFDSVIAFDGKVGNGFRFNNYNAHELLYTVKNALEYFNSERWSDIRNNAISSRFDWIDSAKEYLSIYSNLLNW